MNDASSAVRSNGVSSLRNPPREHSFSGAVATTQTVDQSSFDVTQTILEA